MDVITPVIACIALFSAIVYRLYEENKLKQKRVRIAKRTNTKVWSRATGDWTNK